LGIPMTLQSMPEKISNLIYQRVFNEDLIRS